MYCNVVCMIVDYGWDILMMIVNGDDFGKILLIGVDFVVKLCEIVVIGICEL